MRCAVSDETPDLALAASVQTSATQNKRRICSNAALAMQSAPKGVRSTARTWLQGAI